MQHPENRFVIPITEMRLYLIAVYKIDNDSKKVIEIPKIEIHLSNLFKREDFRHHSYISKGVHGVICGFGPNSYGLAVEGMVKLI